MDAKTPNCQVIAVGNQKGGVGKTTTTVNLAAALGTLGKRCLIIDLDANCGATHSFHIPPDSFLGSNEVLMGAEDPLAVALETDPDEGILLPDNVKLIPGNRALENAERALADKYRMGNYRSCLREPIRQIRESGQFDYVFLDTAPNIQAPTAAAYWAADWFILTATAELLAIQGMNDAMSDIREMQTGANPKLRLLGVLLSSVSARTRLGAEVVGWVEKAFKGAGEFGDFKTRISRSIAVPEAQKFGKTIIQTEPAHKVAEEYRQLAKEVIERIELATTQAAASAAAVGGEIEAKPAAAAVGEAMSNG